MGFREATETVTKRNVEGKIQVVRGGHATGLDLKGIGAERQKLLGVGPEEPEGDAIFAAAEFLVPIGGELIVGEFSWGAHHERPRVDVGAACSSGWIKRARHTRCSGHGWN